MKTKQFRNLLEQRKGKQKQILEDLYSAEADLKTTNKDLIKHEQAKEIIREVGLKTMQQIQYHISDITSLALEAVFENPYKLELDFVQRRNKTECDIFFTRGENKIDPISASGGGAVDVAAFALRIACWSLTNPHTRQTIILDEPMKFVSEDLKDQASLMIKEVSQKLGIQIIMITHEPKFTINADKVFEVRKTRQGISKVIS